MEEIMKNLNIERGHIKAALTRFKGYFETTGKSDNASILQKRLDKCVPLYDKFDVVQCKIEELVADTAAETTQSAEREHFEAMYFAIIAEVETYIASKCPRAGISTNVLPLSSNNSPIPQDATMNVKLPTISLPTFDGAYDGWVKFRDTFESLIHNNNALSDIERFHYLNSALTGNAARVIQSLGVSSANYTVAWQSLKDRFEDSKSLIYYHVKSLVNVNNVTKGSSSSLRTLIDDTNNHLLALKSLNEPTEHWYTLMIYIISTKLDPATKREWERRWFGQSGKIRLRDILNFLEEQSKILEHSASDSQLTSSSSQHQQVISGKSARHTSRVGVHLSTNEKNCNFCNESHSIYNCKKLRKLAPAARGLEVQKLQLCFNCLQPGHRNKTCTRGSCRKCNRKHHTLLHLETNEQREMSDQESMTSSEQENDSAPETTYVNHARVTVQSQAKRHVLLSTALVYLRDAHGKKHKCRALLDSGSQAHFLTRDFCQKLQLPCNSVSTTMFGIGQTEHGIKQETRVQLHSRYGHFKKSFTCLVIPKIMDDHRPTATLNAASIPVPASISMADPQFAKPGRIDMLIGADLFWELLCNGWYRPGPQYPLLQRTKLGWIVAGSANRSQHKQQDKSICNLAIISYSQSQCEQSYVNRASTQDDLAQDNVRRISTARNYGTARPLRNKENGTPTAVKISVTKRVKAARMVQSGHTSTDSSAAQKGTLPARKDSTTRPFYTCKLNNEETI